MDRDFIIKVAKQVFGLEVINLNDMSNMLYEFLVEKQKNRDKIDLFIKTITKIPTHYVLDYYMVALEYYMIKYNVYTISKTSTVLDTQIHGNKIIHIY